MTSENGWTVTFEAAGESGVVEDDALGRFLDLLADLGGSVSGGHGHARYGATFSIDASDKVDSALLALEVGSSVFWTRAEKAGLPDWWPIVRADVMTYAEHDAELERPVLPELVSVTEIADILGVSRQRAHQITKKPDFPEPIARLGAGPIWTRPSLELFVERWREGKPDVSAEVATFDAEIEQLRRIRNQMVHGNLTTVDLENLGAAAAQMLQAAAGTLSAEQGMEAARRLNEAAVRGGRPASLRDLDKAARALSASAVRRAASMGDAAPESEHVDQ